MSLLMYAIAGLILAISAFLLYGLHRLCILLEDHGYMYYRKRSEGGGGAAAGVMMDVDKVIRPSTEHVVEAKDHYNHKQDERSDGA